MAQKREKDETLAPLSLSCPTCAGSSGPDSARLDLGTSEKAEPPRATRSEKLRVREDDHQETAEEAAAFTPPSICEPAAKKAVNRCSGCGKRVGLTGFRCRCGDLFCSEHRYSDRHDCSYDYKAAGREAIARENPVVRAAKILKV